MKRLVRIIDKFASLGGWMAGIMICLALGLVISEIIVRSVFSSTLYIAEEYSGYLMCMLTFCALAYTLREKGHIRMVFLHKGVKGRPREVLDLVCYAVGFVFCLTLAYHSFYFFWDSVVNESQSMQISETYLAIPQVFMPFGALIMAVQFIGEFVKGLLVLRGDIDGLTILEESDELGR